MLTPTTLAAGDHFLRAAGEGNHDIIHIATPQHLVSGFCCQHQAPASAGEDCVGIAALKPFGSLLAVADGVGGEAAGERASLTAITELMELSQATFKSDEQAIAKTLQTIMHANQTIMDWKLGSATTLTAVLMMGELLTFFHIGDSFACLVSQRGKRKHKTIAQSSMGYANASKMDFDTAQSEREEHHWLHSALGQQPLMIETTQCAKPAKRDRLILGSDGISDNLAIPNLVDDIRTGKLHKKTLHLKNKLEKQMASEQGHVDDYSLLCARRLD